MFAVEFGPSPHLEVLVPVGGMWPLERTPFLLHVLQQDPSLGAGTGAVTQTLLTVK